MCVCVFFSSFLSVFVIRVVSAGGSWFRWVIAGKTPINSLSGKYNSMIIDERREYVLRPARREMKMKGRHRSGLGGGGGSRSVSPGLSSDLKIRA